MKLKTTIKIFLLIPIFLFASCNQNEFLDLIPKDKMTVQSTFTTYDNILTYLWRFYDALPGYDNEIAINSDWDSDLLLRSVPNGERDWIWQRMIVPGASRDWSNPYVHIRGINILLDNLDNADITDDEYNHLRSVGLFFRAYHYADLLNKYGGVPLVLKTITDTDTDILFGSRNTRNEVAQQILEDLIWAEQNIKPEGDGHNTINIHVVRALISRFGLREGTWRKYHNLMDVEIYLRASVEASEDLLQDFQELHPNYDEVFNSESLRGLTGILLYKQYEANQFTHQLSTLPRSTSGRHDLTKKAVDLYLLQDGMNRWVSPMFEGDQNPYDEFRNRDIRLLYTVTPPYRVLVNHPSHEWSHTEDPADREYIDLMAELSDDNHKMLPLSNWSGNIVREMPHFADFNLGQAFNVTYSGYQLYKFYNELNTGISREDTNDAPLFRLGEIMLNYAEAKYELNEFDQGIADMTINKLRARGKVAALDINAIPEDPSRDSDITPLMWEIRRERAIELIGEGFRFDDLRRWRKMDYASEQKIGRFIVAEDVDNNIPIQNNESEGYIAYFGNPPAFQEHYYLYPLPSDQIVLNPNLEQNPGWE